MARKPPVIRFLPTGQPMIRTPRGPRFGKLTQAAGPFERIGERMTIGMIDGCVEVAQRIMDQSLIEVPKDTLTLMSSARFSVVETVSGDLEIEMGYGYGYEINPKTKRPSSEYAVPVHERVEVEHAPPTKAKYLEDPVLEHASALEPFIAKNIKAKLLSSGVGASEWSVVASGATLASEFTPE